MRIPRVVSALACSLALLFAASQLAAADSGQKTARVRIPKDFKYGGQLHARGAYGVRIETAADGAQVVLLGKDGTEIVRELAIVQDKKGKVRATSAVVQMMTRDEKMIRVIVREGDKAYLAYFETTS